MRTIWILGGTDVLGPAGLQTWEVRGAFETHDEAAAACRPGEFIGPMSVGERLPDESVFWPDAKYPKGAK